MTHWRRLAVTTLLMASLIGAVRAQTIVHGSADAYAGPGV